MAEQATPSVPDSTTAMESPHDPDKVVVYDKELKRDGEESWIEGPAIDPAQFP